MFLWVWGDRAFMPSILLLLLIPLLASLAGALEVTDEAQVIETEWYDVEPCVGVDSAGNLNIIYFTTELGENGGLVYRRVDTGGNTLAGPTTVTPSSLDEVDGWDLCVDAQDRVHIVYSASLGGAFHTDVYYTQLATDGAIAVSSKRVFQSNHFSYQPQVGTDISGNAYLVFYEMGIEEIRWMKLSASGAIKEDCTDITGNEPDTEIEVYCPRIAVSELGSSFVVWFQKDSAVSAWGIRYTCLSPVGTARVEPRYVEQDRRMEARWLQTALDGTDNLHMAYLEQDPVQIDTLGVYYARVDPDGVTTDSRVTVAKAFRAWCGWCDLETSMDGDVYLLYVQSGGVPRQATRMLMRVKYEDQRDWGEENTLAAGDVASPYVSRGASREDLYGVSYSKTEDIWVLSFSEDPINRPPIASLAVNPSNPEVDQTVTFDGGASHDPDPGDAIERYCFDWGDGGTSGWTASSTATHAYASSGTYSANLWVEDTHGVECEEPSILIVRVSSPTNKPPTAVLTARPTTVDVGMMVDFNGGSSSDPDGTVLFWNFVFGDGVNTGWVTTSVVSHSYTKQGQYTAMLQVEDDDGAVSENTALVQVTAVEINEPPIATIESISQNPILEGENVTFVGRGVDGDGQITKYSWWSNLDGLISGEETFVTDSLSVGPHIITFKVQDDDDDWSEEVTAEVLVKENTQPELDDLTAIRKTSTDKPVEFRVRYTDGEGDVPTLARLYYKLENEGEYKSEPILEVDADDDNFTDGKEYSVTVKLNKPGTWSYYYAFENSKNPIKKTRVGEIRVEEHSSIPGFHVHASIGTLLIAIFFLALLGSHAVTDKS